MNILFFTHYAALYGANRSLINMILGLRTHGYVVRVIVPSEGELTQRLTQIDCRYNVIAFSPSVYRSCRKSFFFRKVNYKTNTNLIDAIDPIISEFNPDLIYSNSSVFDFGFRVAKRFNIKHFWHIREMAQLHYGYHFFPNKEQFVYGLQQSDQIVAISDAVAKEVLEKNTIKNFQVVYNAVFSRKAFNQIDIFHKNEDQPTVFTVVGMLHPSKQQALIIKAFSMLSKEFKHVELWIVGSGQLIYSLYLKWLILSSGGSAKIKMLGYQSDLSSIYNQSDVILTASKHEGLGRSTIEGMAYGKPIIGYNSGATPELIENGIRGLLFKNPTAIDLKEKMKQLMNAVDREKMGMNGRSFVEKHFLEDIYAKKIHALLQSMENTSK